MYKTSDSLDCGYQCSMFIGYANKLISKCGHLQSKVLLNLYNTFCCSFYESSMVVVFDWLYFVFGI